jgi:two-component system nitrate/nitrite sensor histidine kinase NarX
MAQNLQQLYAGLEQKVNEKTASLETERARLAALYEVSAFLADANTLDALAQGFAQRIRRIAGADSVAIRWSGEANERYLLLAGDSLPRFMIEAILGACLLRIRRCLENLPQLLAVIRANRCRIQPSRSYPRPPRKAKPHFHLAYKLA